MAKMVVVNTHEWTGCQLANLLDALIQDETAAASLLRLRPGTGWRRADEAVVNDNDPRTMLHGDPRIRQIEHNEAMRWHYEQKFALQFLQGTQWIRDAMEAGWIARTEKGLTPTNHFGESPVTVKMKELEMEHIRICTRIGEAERPQDLAPHQKEIWRQIKAKGSYGWYFPYHRLFRQHRPSGLPRPSFRPLVDQSSVPNRLGDVQSQSGSAGDRNLTLRAMEAGPSSRPAPKTSPANTGASPLTHAVASPARPPADSTSGRSAHEPIVQPDEPPAKRRKPSSSASPVEGGVGATPIEPSGGTLAGRIARSRRPNHSAECSVAATPPSAAPTAVPSLARRSLQARIGQGGSSSAGGSDREHREWSATHEPRKSPRRPQEASRLPSEARAPLSSRLSKPIEIIDDSDDEDDDDVIMIDDTQSTPSARPSLATRLTASATPIILDESLNPDDMSSTLDAILHPDRAATEARRRASLGVSLGNSPRSTPRGSRSSSRAGLRDRISGPPSRGMARQASSRSTGSKSRRPHSVMDFSYPTDTDEDDDSAPDDMLVTPDGHRYADQDAPWLLGFGGEANMPIALGENVLGFALAGEARHQGNREAQVDGGRSASGERAVLIMTGGASVSPVVRYKPFVIDDGDLDGGIATNGVGEGSQGCGAGEEITTSGGDGEHEDWIPMWGPRTKDGAGHNAMHTAHAVSTTTHTAPLSMLGTDKDDKDDNHEGSDNIECNDVELRGENDSDDWVLELQRLAGDDALLGFMDAVDEVSRD